MSLETPTIPRATIDDLARVEGKAELIGGRIVMSPASGHRHNYVAGRIYISLMSHSQETGRGFVYTDSIGFVVPGLSSGRESFSPDVSFYDGPPPADERDFIDGPPTFAVEVRSKNDYGKAAERQMAAKRADYFEAGTLVVWDVDPDHRRIHVYRRESPDRPDTFGPGQEVDAEPAVSGWRIAVDRIFS